MGTPVLHSTTDGAALRVVGDPEEGVALPGVPASTRLRWAACRRAGGGCRRGWRRRAGLFDAYLERIRALGGGERPRTGPDPSFADHR